MSSESSYSPPSNFTTHPETDPTPTTSINADLGQTSNTVATPVNPITNLDGNAHLPPLVNTVSTSSSSFDDDDNDDDSDVSLSIFDARGAGRSRPVLYARRSGHPPMRGGRIVWGQPLHEIMQRAGANMHASNAGSAARSGFFVGQPRRSNKSTRNADGPSTERLNLGGSSRPVEPFKHTVAIMHASNAGGPSRRRLDVGESSRAANKKLKTVAVDSSTDDDEDDEDDEDEDDEDDDEDENDEEDEEDEDDEENDEEETDGATEAVNHQADQANKHANAMEPDSHQADQANEDANASKPVSHQANQGIEGANAVEPVNHQADQGIENALEQIHFPVPNMNQIPSRVPHLNRSPPSEDNESS